MKTNNVLLLLAACGCAGAAASARPAPYLINVSGATLLKNFLKSSAATIDFVDADNDSVIREQLAPFDLSPPFNADMLWQVNYRAVGSVNGFQDLVDWGRTFATGANGVELAASEAADDAIINRTNYVTAGVPQGNANLNNPGGIPLRSLMDGTFEATTSTNPASAGILIDMAPIDVSSRFAITYPGAPAFDRQPGDAGYGLNPRDSVNKDGSPANFNHMLVDPGSLNFNYANPDADTVYDTPLAYAPIALMTNYGTGMSQATITEIRHMFTTGRTLYGENIVAVTRDAGSGTRNAFNNHTGADPSWGVGENIGNQSNTSSQDILGANFRPSNKGGGSRVIGTVVNHRLALGYAGAETGINNAWLSGGRADCIAIRNDLNGGTEYARPHIDKVLDNTLNGYNVGGDAVYATFGDPRASAMGHPYFGDNNGNPKMRNENAAAHLNNITRSVAAFKALPGPGQEFMPGEFLANTLILTNARDFRTDFNNPTNVEANPNLNQALQDFTRANNVISNPLFLAFNHNINGLAPTRTALSGGATYTDGVVNGANYITEGGTVVGNGANLNGGALLAVGQRNKIAYDFNNDGARNISDTAALIAAWRDRNGGPAVNDPNLCIEMIGDGNGDGNFNAKDVRYFADGLAMVAGVVDGAAVPVLDRKAGFTQVDVAFGGNFFGTTLATPKAYANGDSRADVSNATHATTRGWEPIGADGVIDAHDIDYVYRQFKNADIADGGDGIADWMNTAEAVSFDLSADMDGDLDVDQCDVRELVRVVLGTNYADVNLDGAVNAADRTIIEQGIAFPPGVISWSTGDVNGDAAVTSADLALYRAVVCPADVDGNGSIAFPDLNIVLSFFGQSGQCLPGSGDTDADGDVDFTDLNVVLSFFGTTCAN